MEIASIEPVAVALPLARPMKLAGVEIRTADNVLCRVETRDGIVGWGEASSAPGMTGETVASMMAAIRLMAPRLVGRDADDFAGNMAVMDFSLYGNASAKSAIEIALYDIVGKARQVTASSLLGPVRRDNAPLVIMIANGETTKDVAQARRNTDDGFVAFKIKVGVGTPEEDAARAATVRDALDDDALVSADANQGFSYEEAVRFAGAIAPARLDWVEQLVMGHDVAGMAKLAAMLPCKLGADEGLHALRDIREHHAAGAAVGGSLKLIKLGGPTRVQEAAVLCAELGMHVNVAAKIAESSISGAAVMALASAAPTLDWGVSVTCQYLAADIVRNPLAVIDGRLRAADGPGLGVDVDEDAVARYAVGA